MSTRPSSWRMLAPAALTLLAFAPATLAAPAKKSLYERLGGEAALKVVVDDFVAAAAPDPAVDFTRGGRWNASEANVQHLKKQLVAFLAQAFGGPKAYAGRSMKDAHHGMGITQAQFDALAGHLKAVLEKHKVPKAELDEVMTIAASTAPDIVEKK